MWEVKEIELSHHVACKCLTTKHATAANNILIVMLIIWLGLGRLHVWRKFGWLIELVLAVCLHTYNCNVIKSRLYSSRFIYVSDT
jgi:hypothetical protein